MLEEDRFAENIEDSSHGQIRPGRRSCVGSRREQQRSCGWTQPGVAPSVEFAKTSGFMKGVAPADRLIKQKVVKGTAAVRCCDAVVTGGGEAEPACCCGRCGIDGKPKFQAEKASLPRGSARRDAAVSASEMRRAERLCPAAERAWQEVAKRTWRTVTAAAASKRSPSSS